MRRRHPLPSLWLFTDPRAGDALLPAIGRLPRGAGVLFRHYELPAGDRRALYERVRAVARRRRLMLVVAGESRTAAAWRADGWHGRGWRRTPGRASLRTAPVHDRKELVAARRAGADLLFVSPVFATRSHPDARPLGARGFAALARSARIPVIALGGMTAARAGLVRGLGAYGWAAIDGLIRT